MNVVGIDPGTGVSSPTGLVKFNSDGEITLAITISSEEKEANRRLRAISDTLKLATHNYENIDLVCIETFVMRGKGGQTLQRLIGAAIATVRAESKIQEVYNTTVKRVIAGTGKADKLEVATGVFNWFHSKNQESAMQVVELINKEEWDILDAFAIGISGFLLYTNEVQ